MYIQRRFAKALGNLLLAFAQRGRESYSNTEMLFYRFYVIVRVEITKEESFEL